MNDYAEAARLIRLGRKAEARKEATKGCLGVFYRLLITIIVRAYALMLGAGIIHNDWIPGLPSLGWWLSLLLCLVLNPLLPGHINSKPAAKS